MNIRFRNIKRIWRNWTDDRSSDKNKVIENFTKKERNCIEGFVVCKIS